MKLYGQKPRGAKYDSDPGFKASRAVEKRLGDEKVEEQLAPTCDCCSDPQPPHERGFCPRCYDDYGAEYWGWDDLCMDCVQEMLTRGR